MDEGAAISIALAVATFALGLLSYQKKNKEPLDKARRDAAEKLRLAVAERQEQIIRARWDEDSSLDEVVGFWERDVNRLRPHLDAELANQADVLTTLLELGRRLNLQRNSGWMQAAHWACFQVRNAAAMHALGKKASSPLLRSPNDVRDLISRGQSLGDPLEELNRTIQDRIRTVIEEEQRDFQRKGLRSGMLLATSAALLVWALFNLLE
ncbi:MAG: hypothetical protein KY456_10510 [Chloroflexi bacterium]|nr:hypothetical protein [Chloroflexota bacterium]